MKKLCSHVRKSHLKIKKLGKFEKIKKFALYFFFGIVFHCLHCISKKLPALSQSELRNIFMYIIKQLLFSYLVQ
jgi:hypothetical protein